MIQTMKRLLSFAFILILVMSLAVPAFAADDDIYPREGSMTVQMNAKKNGTVMVQLASGYKNFTINRADVKVSKGTSGAKLTQFVRNGGTNSSSMWGINPETKKWEKVGGGTSRNCQYYVVLTLQQAGTAKVTYKIGDEKYTISITAEAYKNPVKSITLSGYKSGKNFAAKAAAYKNIKLSANIKNAKLKVTAADGWKLSEIWITDQTAGFERSRSYGSGPSTGTLRWGKMLKSHKYTLGAYFYRDNGPGQSISYTVN